MRRPLVLALCLHLAVGPGWAVAGDGTGKKITDWIRDIPRRFTRRFAPEKQGIFSAAEARRLIEESPVKPFSGNAAQREADSDATRPLRVTAQLEAGKVQKVLERMIAFGGIQALRNALTGKGRAPEVVAQAGKVVAQLGPAQQQALTRGLSTGVVGRQIAQALGGKPTSALGRLVKDGFGNNIVLAVAASGLVNVFFDDGLDMATLKDHLVALNALQDHRGVREEMIARPVEALAYYHMDRGATALFGKLWSRFGGSPPVAGAVSQKAIELGRQASSLGLPGISGGTALTAHGVAQAAFKAGTLGLLGMPALNTLWRLLAGMPDGTYVGGNREKSFARYDLPNSYFQRTGDKLKDAVEDRKVAVTNLWEGYRKFPFTNAMDYGFRFMGGYMGAVIASALIPPLGIAGLVGTLVVSAVFSEGGVALGRWLGAKLDTSSWFYGMLREGTMKRIFLVLLATDAGAEERAAALRALTAVDRARLELGVTRPEDLAELRREAPDLARDLDHLASAYLKRKARWLARLAARAAARADDFEDLMAVSQVDSRIQFVGRLEDVRITREDGYSWLHLPGWREKASPRFDFVDAAGRRGVWDHRTDRVLAVGKIREENGKKIAFLDDTGVRIEGDVLRDKPDVGKIDEQGKPTSDSKEGETGDALIASNGIVFERAASGEWKIRGYGGEYDIVLRATGRRFVWDGEDFRLHEPGTPRKVDEEKKRKRREKSVEVGRKLIRKFMGKGDPAHRALVDLGRLHVVRAGEGNLGDALALR